MQMLFANSHVANVITTSTSSIMNELRARDFIDWDAVWNAEIQTHPYTYCEVDLINQSFVN